MMVSKAIGLMGKMSGLDSQLGSMFDFLQHKFIRALPPPPYQPLCLP